MIHALEAEILPLRQLQQSREQLENDRSDLRRQRRAVAAVLKDREHVRRKLDEIFAALDNVRLD
jgi:hypothetical protein